MITQRNPYGIGATVALDYDTAVGRVKEALANEGFGILSEIDVAATMKKKLDIDFRPYVILGACNPPLAHEALTAEPDIGLLLPCNVIVYAADVPGRSVIAAMDPVAALELTGNSEIRELAEKVKTRLTRALQLVERAASTARTSQSVRSTPEPRTDPMKEHFDQMAKDCIAACNDCATACGHCFAHMSGKASSNACPSCCVECAAICRLCADALARHSPFAKQLCKLCADICDWCAKECGAHDMSHCKECAAACRKCAEACRKMAA